MNDVVGTDINNHNDDNNDDGPTRSSYRCNINSGIITITLLSFGLNLVNYLDRAVIGSAADQIIKEFDLNNMPNNLDG